MTPDTHRNMTPSSPDEVIRQLLTDKIFLMPSERGADAHLRAAFPLLRWRAPAPLAAKSLYRLKDFIFPLDRARAAAYIALAPILAAQKREDASRRDAYERHDCAGAISIDFSAIIIDFHHRRQIFSGSP